jgi:hypothetical protein
MTDKLYPKFKAQCLKGAIDLSSALLEVRAMLIDVAPGDYTYNDAHEFLSDVPLAARLKRTNPFTGKTVNLTTAAFDSDDPTAEAVTGENIARLILYINTGVDATSRLIHYKDTGITTVPFTPDGSDIRIVVNASGWFAL